MEETIAVAVARIEAKLDALLAQGGDHEKRLRHLEGHGGRRWDGLIGQIITLVVAAACGLFAGKIMK